MSTRAKAVVVVAKIEGEPLEPNCVVEGEGRRSRRRSRRRAPRVELYQRGRRSKLEGRLMHADGPSKVVLRRRLLMLMTCFFNNNVKTKDRVSPFRRCQFIHLQRQHHFYLKEQYFSNILGCLRHNCRRTFHAFGFSHKKDFS